MLPVGAAFTVLALRGIRPDATKWRYAFSQADDFATGGVSHVTIRLALARVLSAERGAPAVMRAWDSLQSGEPCSCNHSQGNEHLKAA